MNLMRAITTVGGYTMLSRVFGFIRDILIANVLGAGMVADGMQISDRFCRYLNFQTFRIPALLWKNSFDRFHRLGNIPRAHLYLFFQKLL